MAPAIQPAAAGIPDAAASASLPPGRAGDMHGDPVWEEARRAGDVGPAQVVAGCPRRCALLGRPRLRAVRPRVAARRTAPR